MQKLLNIITSIKQTLSLYTYTIWMILGVFQMINFIKHISLYRDTSLAYFPKTQRQTSNTELRGEQHERMDSSRQTNSQRIFTMTAELFSCQAYLTQIGLVLQTSVYSLQSGAAGYYSMQGNRSNELRLSQTTLNRKALDTLNVQHQFGEQWANLCPFRVTLLYV